MEAYPHIGGLPWDPHKVSPLPWCHCDLISALTQLTPGAAELEELGPSEHKGRVAGATLCASSAGHRTFQISPSRPRAGLS